RALPLSSRREFSMGKQLLLSLILGFTLNGALPALGQDQPISKESAAVQAPAALVEALQDKDPGVRLQAAQFLTQMGEGKRAVPALVELLKASQKSLRLEAAQLLKQLGPFRLRAV